jgi:hypothetical protein
MKALSFWKAVTLDKSNLLEEVFALLQDNGVRFCVIDGQAVNVTWSRWSVSILILSLLSTKSSR